MGLFLMSGRAAIQSLGGKHVDQKLGVRRGGGGSDGWADRFWVLPIEITDKSVNKWNISPANHIRRGKSTSVIEHRPLLSKNVYPKIS